LAVGTLIGAVGVGGVLLVPVLIYLTELDVHQAMATALCTFVATGVVGTYAFQRQGSIEWWATVLLCSGALLCGYLGAMVNAWVEAEVLTVVLALLILGAGLYTITSAFGFREPAFAGRPLPQNLLLLGLGSVAGFSSGLTGTGGPLVAVPLMIMFGFPPLMSIGAGQVIQIVAALSGTLGNLRYGQIDFSLVPLIALCQVLGVLLGVKIVHAVNVVLVRQFVAWLCVMVGVGLLASAMFGTLPGLG
jgi:uncharacterized membrane protein YfcA